MKSATLGNGSEMSSTLKGLNRTRVMQPRWGWGLFWRMTQGSPAWRANPGLNDGIPLGFGLRSQPFAVGLVVTVPTAQGGVAGVGKKKLQRRRFNVAVAKDHVGFALVPGFGSLSASRLALPRRISSTASSTEQNTFLADILFFLGQVSVV